MNGFRTSLVLLATTAAACAADPFAGVEPRAAAVPAPVAAGGWTDNLLFRKEIYLLGAAGEDDFEETDRASSRLSAGFEIQKRFSTATKTVASVN